MSGQRRLEVGRVVKAHGLRGEVKVRLYNPESDILETVDTVWLRTGARGETPFNITARRLVGKHIALAFEGVADRTRAEALAGALILVPRAALPALEEDEYYHADIVGLKVEDSSGRPIGIVADIYPGGAHDLFVIDGDDESRWLVPAVARFVVRIDVSGGKIVVDHLEDLDTAGATSADTGGSSSAV